MHVRNKWSRPDHSPSSAIVVARSRDAKLGDCSATHLSQWSCPITCPMLGVDGKRGNCYAESTKTRQRFTTHRLNSSLVRSPLAIARELAEKVCDLADSKKRKGKKLRYSVVGDASTRASAYVQGVAASYWFRKTNIPVYGYTHSDQTYRSDWGDEISMLASVQTIDPDTHEIQRNDVNNSIASFRSRGYKFFSVIIAKHEHGSQPYTDPTTGLRLIACRYQLPNHSGRKVTCDHCNLCLESCLQSAGLDGVAFQLDDVKVKRKGTA